MRLASALTRYAAPVIAAGVLLAGCGQAPTTPVSVSDASTAAPGGPASQSPGTTPAGKPAARSGAGSPGEPVAAGSGQKSLVPLPNPATMAPGSVYRNPANGRDEVVVSNIARTALLIGDSQSEPTTGWPRQGLAAAGYDVYFCGLGGTGYVAANGKTGNYIDALQRGDWKLPYGSPPLVVMEGGGNDASRGATDAQIVANAERLIASLRQRYPGAVLAMIGTLARGANYGGGRRTQVDALLGDLAARDSIPFISTGDWLTKYDLTSQMADGVHMNTSGHAALGKILAARLKELGLALPPAGPDATAPAS